MAWWKFSLQWFYTDVREDSGLGAYTEKVQTQLHLTQRDWQGFIELVPWNQERLLLYFMPLRTIQGSTTATRGQNDSSVAEFILLGFSAFPELQWQMFGAFLVIYLVTLIGNALIITIIFLDQSLHIPMYLFLQNLSVVEMSFSAAIIPEMLVVLTSEKATISFGGCFLPNQRSGII